MAFMHDGTAVWLDGIGAGETKEKLLSAMKQTKELAEADKVMHKDEDTMDETLNEEQLEETVVDEVEVKEEAEVEVEAEDETVVDEVEVKEEAEVEVEAEATDVVDTKDGSDVLVEAVGQLAESVNKSFGDIADTFVQLRDELAELSAELAELKAADKEETAKNSFALPAMSFAALLEEKATKTSETKDATDPANLAEELLKDAPVEDELEDDEPVSTGFITFN